MLSFKAAKELVWRDMSLNYIYQEKPYTYVFVTYTDENGDEYDAEAITKFHPGCTDEWNEQRGINVAKGRAVAKIARKLLDNYMPF